MPEVEGAAVADAEDGRLFELSEKYRALHREAREFAASVRDIAERADEAGDIDPEMRKRLAASGIGSIMVPAEFGGRYEKVDSLAVTLAREAFAAESAHLDSLLGM
jgi:acyl-CoA dehydrogenase